MSLTEKEQKTLEALISTATVQYTHIPICTCGRNLRSREYIGRYLPVHLWLRTQSIPEEKKGLMRQFVFERMGLSNHSCCRMYLQTVSRVE